MYKGKVLALNGLFSWNQTHKSCLRRSAVSEVWKICGVSTPPLCQSLNNSYRQDGQNESDTILHIVHRYAESFDAKRFFFSLLSRVNSAKSFLVFRVSTTRSSCKSVIKEMMLLGCSRYLSTLQWLLSHLTVLPRCRLISFLLIPILDKDLSPWKEPQLSQA